VRGGRTEGTGLTWVEHIILQRDDDNAEDDYSNCVYSCRFCNRARSTNPIIRNGKRLLNPTQDAWADHFDVMADEFKFRPRTRDAEYTCDSYDINAPDKVELRRLRNAVITHHQRWVSEGPEWLTELLTEAEACQHDPSAFAKKLSRARLIRQTILRAIEDLASLRAIPNDAPDRCRCENTQHALPEALDEQYREFPPLERLLSISPLEVPLGTE
jgi:hypothetical protein